MLTVVSGAFHPGLENAFIERIKALKKDPLTPIAVVAPSSRLLNRLETALAEEGLSLLNVHFHTLASFSESTVVAETELEKPLLSDPLFFDTLVKIILKEDKPFEALSDVAVPEGFPPAVRSTLRDLLDAGIDERNVAQAIKEEFAGREVDLGTLRSLLRLHHLYLKRLKTLPVSSRADLLKQAIEIAHESEWIGQFSEIIFYGFYDMTGNQTDFFQAVAKNHPTRFFFPYVKDHPAYAFAKRFRDNFLPVSNEEVVIARSEATKQSHKFMRSPRSAKDAELAMTDIRIVNISGLNDEAWFVASEINRLHQEEKIPFSKIGVIARAQNRLTGALPRTLRACDIPYHSAASESFFDLPVVQAAHQMLEEASTGWPGKDSWSGYADLTAAFLEKTFRDEPQILKSIEELATFDLLATQVSNKEFLETLKDRWSRMERPKEGESEAGVSLLYAEAARGIPFEAVFLLGIEEKVFPRIIREDPFLRDDARLALNQTLGHKIGQKMTALEEERLLFEIFTRAASKKLVLTYQRSDDDGAIVGASSFLRAFAEENHLSMDTDVDSLPRAALAKITSAKPSTLSRRDIVTGFLAAGRDKDALEFSKEDPRAPADLTRGLALQRGLHLFDAPGPYDGLINERETSILFRGGALSPTSLELYGQCPFKYFAMRVLELEAKEDDLIEEALAADVRGTAVHNFLEKFFRKVTREGTQGLPAKFPEPTFNTVFDAIIGQLTAAEVNLHPVLWQAAKINLKERLKVAVQLDYEECLRSGFTPAYFEAEEKGTLEPFGETVWFGKIDRIDLGNGEARVVDYKTGRTLRHKSVAPLVVRGEKSQAPLYVLLAQNLFDRLKKDVSQISFVYLYLFDGHESRVFSAQDWAACRGAIVKTINKQVELIKSGNFVMLPGDYCSYCDVKPVCRVHHSLSAYRAKRGAGAKLLEIRNQKFLPTSHSGEARRGTPPSLPVVKHGEE